MAKGDLIRVLYDANGEIREITAVADKAGRSVRFDADDRKNRMTVEVLGRAGSPVRTIMVRLDKVVLTEEVPA